MTITDKIEEQIEKEFNFVGTQINKDGSYMPAHVVKEKIKKHTYTILDAYAEEIIGKDEYSVSDYSMPRNQLRSEQRKHHKEIMKGGK